MKGTDLAPVSPPDLAQIDLVLRQLEFAGGLSPGTRTKYEARSRRFVAWCIETGLTRYPADPVTVGRYVTWLLIAGHSRSAIGVDLAAIAWLHRQGHVADPCRDPLVRSVRAEIRSRKAGAPVARRRPLSLAELRAMLLLCPSGVVGARDAALLAVGWWCGMRRSEIVGLDVRDVEWIGAEAAITVRRSKRDQTGVGRVIGLPLARDPVVCPVRRLSAWLDMIGYGPIDGPPQVGNVDPSGPAEHGADDTAKVGDRPILAADEVAQRQIEHAKVGDRQRAEPSGEPLFMGIDRWGNFRGRLLGDYVRWLLLDYAVRADLPKRGLLGGHSLRAGVATDLRRAGVALDDIARLLGHADINTTRGYVRGIDALGADNPLRRL